VCFPNKRMIKRVSYFVLSCIFAWLPNTRFRRTVFLWFAVLCAFLNNINITDKGLKCYRKRYWPIETISVFKVVRLPFGQTGEVFQSQVKEGTRKANFYFYLKCTHTMTNERSLVILERRTFINLIN
jgi:hypothetical protein